MNKELCKEIQYRVRRYLAPSSDKAGMIKLSYIWGLWRNMATRKEIKDCLEEMNCITRNRGDDTIFIFPSIAKERYQRLREKYQKLKGTIQEKREEKNQLKNELNILDELRRTWLQEIAQIKLGEFEKKLSLNLLSTYISNRFQIKEKQLISLIEDKENSLKEFEKKTKPIKRKIKNIKEKLNYV